MQKKSEVTILIRFSFHLAIVSVICLFLAKFYLFFIVYLFTEYYSTWKNTMDQYDNLYDEVEEEAEADFIGAETYDLNISHIIDDIDDRYAHNLELEALGEKAQWIGWKKRSKDYASLLRELLPEYWQYLKYKKNSALFKMYVEFKQFLNYKKSKKLKQDYNPWVELGQTEVDFLVDDTFPPSFTHIFYDRLGLVIDDSYAVSDASDLLKNYSIYKHLFFIHKDRKSFNKISMMEYVGSCQPTLEKPRLKQKKKILTKEEKKKILYYKYKNQIFFNEEDIYKFYINNQKMALNLLKLKNYNVIFKRNTCLHSSWVSYNLFLKGIQLEEKKKKNKNG